MSLKCKEGDWLECIKPHSNAYTKYHYYQVVKDLKGNLCIEADDCLLDLVSLLISDFKNHGKVKPEAKKKDWYEDS